MSALRERCSFPLAMSAFGGKADTRELPSGGLLIATTCHASVASRRAQRRQILDGAEALKRGEKTSKFRHVTKPVTKHRRKCANCRKRLPRQKTGRPRRYCSRSCRQRAYEKRRAETSIPLHLFTRDHNEIQSRDGIKRAVVDVLRELGFLPSSPSPENRKRKLKLVTDDDNQP